jgi:flagellar assembly protein FliH
MAARQSEEEKAAEVKQQAEAAAKQLVDDATAKAAALAKDAKDAVKKDRDSAREEGKKEGREEAWKSGQDEAVRLVERLRTVLEKTQAIRADVLSATESQLVLLARIISRKVIKSLASSQEGIVVDTVKAALAKVKGRGKIVIRVNTADMNLTTAHTKDFVNMLEVIENVEVQEDSTIGVGGCVVETSFGEIDARIESQLNELEDRITTLSPIKGKA